MIDLQFDSLPTWRLVLGGILLAGVSGLGLAGALTGFEIMDAVNAKLPEKEQFDPIGWYASKNRRLTREYRRLYPSGQLLLRQEKLGASMFACVLTAGLSFGMPLLPILGLGVILGASLWFSHFRRD